jgi:hypothetical protein
MRAQRERQYDEYERMAYGALMARKATNEKRIKPSDLFERPKDGSQRKGRKSAKELREQIESQQALLAQFTFAKKA